jgi:hypothetical protein
MSGVELNLNKAIEAASATTGNLSLGDEDLKALRIAPMLVGMFVSMASPSGFIGTAKEAGAVASMLNEAAGSAPAGSLLAKIFAGGASGNDHESVYKMMRDAKGPDELKGVLLGAIKQAGTVIGKGSAEESGAYKQMLVSAATKVAEASKEGGFLGFGGVKVNDAEQAAIAEIKSALGVM